MQGCKILTLNEDNTVLHEYSNSGEENIAYVYRECAY